ncbi:MAG: tyrosine-type recombinase/integrase, partial [Desulfobacterales bacterium]|nr:tyrosine-type recombinase/integrase [Desulfobacterales bacterium]
PIALSSGTALQRRDSCFPPSWQLGAESERFREVVDGLALTDLPGKEHLQHYLQGMVRRNFRRLTIQQALSTLKFFLAFLRDTGKDRLEQVSRRDLEAFVEREQDGGLKLSSVKTKLDRVHAFLGFLVEEEVVAPEVLVRKIRLKLPQYLPRAMDPADVKKLLSVIEEVRDRAMVLVLLRTGMRISELLATRASEVNIEERRIAIWEGAKTRRGRVVYFSDDCRDALKRWLERRDSQREFLFYARGRSTFSYSSAWVMFDRYLGRAGLAHKGYSLHCLRHTFASELLNAGMRLECLQQLLGHDSIQVTRRYARLTDKTREQEYFGAMAIIEKGAIDGTYRLDHQLPAISQETKRLTPYGQKLHDKPGAVSPVAGRGR